MDRNREGRRGSMAAANGLSRRRQRSSSLRDSPEEDGPVELQETARLRDRGNKKDRDRDRSSRNKRRRGDRLTHVSNREEGEESSEESVDDEEEDEDEDSGAVRMLPPNPASSSSLLNHHHRKSFPPAKVVRAAPTWKAADEMIGVSVPRKARSASAKRSHDYWISGGAGGGGGGEQIHRQASTSPARPNATVPSPSPISPSSSNVSARKKMKSLGPKHRPPKISKSSSAVQEDIEIEVAEVLYGLMRQSHCPPKQEVLSNASQKLDAKDTNGSSTEAKSRVSSPISISPSAAAQQPSLLPQNSSTSTTPLPAVVPKRKKPRPVKIEEENPAVSASRNGSISSVAGRVDSEQHPKMEVSSPKLDKNSVSENAGSSFNLGSSQAAAVSSAERPQSESVKPVSKPISDPKSFTEESENRDGVHTGEEVPQKKESPPCTELDVDLEDAAATKAVSTGSEVENKREEKFKIDLMAPPPLKSSPERDGDIDYASDPKSMALDVEMKTETVVKADENVEKIGKQDTREVKLEEKNGLEEKKTDAVVEDSGSQKPLANKERIPDLQIDLEKLDKDCGTGNVGGSKQKHQQHPQAPNQQQQPKASRNDPKTEKTTQSTSLPLPMTLPGWPGGLPSLGYMPPLQTVVSMDGNTGSSTGVQLPHFIQSQSQPKRCAIHYYIARKIYHHQQFTRVNPFWPAAAGSVSLYGAKPYNLNVVPPTETTILGNQLQGSFPGRNLNSVPDKGQVASTFLDHTGKDKCSAAVAANFMDATQRKQLVLQQAPQPAAAGNLLNGPAFIFPLNQQPAAATRSGAVKSATTSNAASSAANTAPGAPASPSPLAATPTTVSFNYPSLPANEAAQYLAILQNNYSFPIPTHVGPPPYRGSHAPAMPFFNGSFYSPQMIPQHQQQPQQQQPHSQPQPIQQGHQKTSTSTGSSSSQKHQLIQQQRLQSGGNNGGGGSPHSFPASKIRLPQQQPSQQNQHVPAPHQSRQHEAEMGGEDSPSTADSRVSNAHKSMFGQNFAMPIHPQNFALMSPAALGGGSSGNHGEKQQQQPHQQSLKGGAELLPSQAFAMTFASFHGPPTASGIDFPSMAQSHAFFQSLPEAARHGYQIPTTASAATAQVAQKKNHHISEEGKIGGDSINAEDERKAMAGKGPASIGQSFAFSRPDSADQSISTVLSNTVIDSSARTLNIISAPSNGNRGSRSTASNATTTIASTPAGTPSSQHQQHQQQQQLIQMSKQQQQQQMQHFAAAASRSKTPTSSNASVYTDRIPSSSSMATKFPNTLSVFPHALIQNNSPAQSPQWKNSVRTTASSVPSPPLASTSASSLKNLPQQQSRMQHGHTQISFGSNSNSKSATSPQGQHHPINNQSLSPAVAGSPPTSSVSKSAGGSPRTTSTGGKAGPVPTLSSQQTKTSPSGPSRKSSPVGGRNVASIPGHSHNTTLPSSNVKSQSQVQQQLQKQALQQPQLYFTNAAAYMQIPSPQSTTATTTSSTTSATTGSYHQRRQSDQTQQQQQGSSTTSSNGMLSLCPPSLAHVTTSDSAKAAAAAAANNMKAGLHPSGLLHYAAQTAGNSQQLLSVAYPYMPAMPTVSVKPAEQKQPAGNDNLHTCWQPEKR